METRLRVFKDPLVTYGDLVDVTVPKWAADVMRETPHLGWWHMIVWVGQPLMEWMAGMPLRHDPDRTEGM